MRLPGRAPGSGAPALDADGAAGSRWASLTCLHLELGHSPASRGCCHTHPSAAAVKGGRPTRASLGDAGTGRALASCCGCRVPSPGPLIVAVAGSTASSARSFLTRLLTELPPPCPLPRTLRLRWARPALQESVPRQHPQPGLSNPNTEFRLLTSLRQPCHLGSCSLHLACGQVCGRDKVLAEGGRPRPTAGLRDSGQHPSPQSKPRRSWPRGWPGTRVPLMVLGPFLQPAASARPPGKGPPSQRCPMEERPSQPCPGSAGKKPRGPSLRVRTTLSPPPARRPPPLPSDLGEGALSAGPSFLSAALRHQARPLSLPVTDPGCPFSR